MLDEHCPEAASEDHVDRFSQQNHSYVRISVSTKDGHYHEMASLHVRIMTKRASNSRNVPGGGGSKQKNKEWKEGLHESGD